MKGVLITGGSRGIGRAMVEAFSAAGWRVAFTYLNSEQAARELEARLGAVAIRADQSSEEQILSAVKTAQSALGSIDALINNAAVSSFSLFTDLTLEEWNRTLSVDLTSAFLYSKAVIPEMINKKTGRIINIASMWGLTGASCEVHYSTAKAGLIGMTKALAKELGPSGITVNAIAPGVILTDMNKALPPEELALLAEDSALLRNGEPSEVAAAALFLAGEGASYITGDVLNVSGGFVI